MSLMQSGAQILKLWERKKGELTEKIDMKIDFSFKKLSWIVIFRRGVQEGVVFGGAPTLFSRPL